MKRALATLAVSLALAGSAAAQQQPQQQPPAQPPQPAVATTQLKVGEPAPDFTLPDQNGNQVKLSDFRGKKNVVLAFYVLAFTGG